MCYFNKELDGDQTVWGQWHGLFWDYSRGEMAYDSQGWTKSTSCRGITTNAILWCRNKKIIASSEQDDETVPIHKPGYWCQKNLKLENFLLIYVNVRHAHKCWHTFRKASYSHQEHSSALKPKAYITLSASQRVKLSEKRPETLSYKTVRTTVLLATKKNYLMYCRYCRARKFKL